MLRNLLENPWLNSFASIATLVFLIHHRKDICPAFYHFMTCMVDEEVYFLNTMAMWMVFKCFLIPDEHSVAGKQVQTQTAEIIFQNRIKTVVLAYTEMLLSLSLCSGSFETLWPYVYCSCAFGFVALRSVFKEQLDLTCFIFLVIYFTQNTLVHIVDLTIHQNFFET